VLLVSFGLPRLAAQTANPGPAGPVTNSATGSAGGILELSHENDAFIFSDRDFTAGTRLAYTTPNYADWPALSLVPSWYGNFFDRISLIDDTSAVVAAGVYAQQNLYTPNNNNLNPPDPTDYPYSGWVGLGLDVVRQTADRRAIFEIMPGWIGPDSGGEDLQDSFHSLIKSAQFQGWSHQIKNEPLLQFTYRQDWRPAALTNLGDPNSGAFNYDVLGHGTITGGNGWDYAAAGVLARWGYHLPLDYGPTRMRLGEIASAPYAAPGSAKNSTGDWSLDALSTYLCFGAEGRAVARDITLDGNTFANSPSVVNKPAVAEVYGGVVMQYKNFRSSFLVIYESKTFYSQAQPGQWRGTLTFGWQF
jgi:hypothetical protein